jgi:signal transduction histidine kinase
MVDLASGGKTTRQSTMREPQNIVSRLIVPLGLTLLIAMIAVWAIAVKLLTDTIDRRLDDQLDHATEILATGEFPFSPELIVRLDRLIEARIALLDESGAVVLSTTDGPANAALQAQSGFIDSGEPVRIFTSEAGENTWRIAIRPLALGRDVRFAYVAAIASQDESRRAASDAAKLLGLAMLIVTALLAWVGHRFTGLARQSRLAGLGELASRIAHEIRNPLTAIKMQLQLLEERAAPDDVARIGNLLNEIRRMETMVESALTVGAPLTLKVGIVQPDVLIHDLAELLKPTLAHRGIDLKIDVADSVDINADADRLKQVLINLINNAADELESGGMICVTTDVSEQSINISVDDSGPGLQPDDHKVNSRKTFGLGLGLTICREIAALHNGELTSASSTMLGGARFTLRLPVRILNRT